MSFEVINLEQGSREWLDFRKNHIGASEAPIIMGESPWRTPYGLWQQKLGLVKEGFSSPAMRRGLELEPVARQRYSSLVGLDFKPVVLKSSKYPFMIASLDGISSAGDIVELKCPGEEDHEKAMRGTVPKKYLFQLLQQMIVSERDRVDYFSYRSDDDCIIIPVLYESLKEHVDALLIEEERFWRCIQNLEEPSLNEKDISINDSLEWSMIAEEYLDIKTQIKSLEDRENEYKEKLLALCGGSNCKGGGLILTQHMRKGTVDYGKVPELKGLNLEPYRKAPSSYWKIREGE